MDQKSTDSKGGVDGHGELGRDRHREPAEDIEIVRERVPRHLSTSRWTRLEC